MARHYGFLRRETLFRHSMKRREMISAFPSPAWYSHGQQALKHDDGAMMRNLITWLFGQKRAPKRKPIIVDADSVSTRKLIDICERYWKRFEPDCSDQDAITDDEHQPYESYENYQLAVKALVNRGPEVRDWARRILSHHDYCARQTGAWLLGELGQRGELGDAIGKVIIELEKLINRPFDDDPPKEATAIDLAIAALAKIGDARGVAVIRQVLFSKRLEHEGDTQWEAVDSLEKLTGESFSKSDNRLESARKWLQAHPNI
jgi:hypothetical protein